MRKWRFFDSPPLSGSANMEIDLGLFRDFEKGEVPSTLRVYSWKPKCISLGYSQEINQEIDAGRAREMGWDVVRRPTGGGIVFHNEAEVTYSLVTAIDDPLLPKGLVPSYMKISQAVIFGLNKLGVPAQIQNKTKNQKPKTQLCFSYPAEYEIVVEGRKIVGSAQKRGRKTLLQQGSVFVRRTPPEEFSVLRRQHDDIDAVSVEEVLGREINFAELAESLRCGFEKVFNFKF